MKKIFSSIIAFVLTVSIITNALASITDNSETVVSDNTQESTIDTVENADIIETAEQIATDSADISAAQTEQTEQTEYSTSTYSTATLTDTEIYLRYFDTLLGNKLNAAYTAGQSDAYVDTATGSMAANVTDLYIPGKDGFDISINRTFNTASSPLREFVELEKDGYTNYARALVKPYICEYVDDGETKTSNVNVYFNNEMELLYAGTRFEGKMYTSSENYYNELTSTSDTSCIYSCAEGTDYTKYTKSSFYIPSSCAYTSESKYTNIGQGWQLQYPNLATVNKFIESHVNSEGETVTRRYVTLILTDRFGKTHSADFTFKEDGNNWKYSSGSVNSGYDHKISFVQSSNISVKATHPTGFVYNMTITDGNGDTYYFDGTSSGSYYTITGISDRHGNVILIDQDDYTYTITDTYGIKYICDRSGIVRVENNVETELVKYEFEAINSELDVNNEFDVDDEYIFTVTKNSGIGNTISSEEPDKTTYYIKQEYKYDRGLDNCNIWLIYSLPYKVVLPTGLTKHFEYTKNESWEIGYEDDTVEGYYYTVTDYKEVGNTPNDIRNHTKYSYTYDTYSDCRIKYVNQAVATTYDGEMIKSVMESSYNSLQMLTNQKLTDSTGKYYVTDKYTYKSGSPKGRISSHVNTVNAYSGDNVSQNYSHTKKYTYTKSRLLSETNGDYVCNYTYYGEENYFLPHTTTYNKDADTTVKVENILTENGKDIAAQNTYENDVLMSSVSYTYDDYGNVASSTVLLEDGTNALTNYAYSYNTDGGYTVTTTQSGIVNADGEAQNDIVTSQTFDWRGNVISATDANGNITTSAYDLLNRPLTVVYPDNTSETYTYDMSNMLTTMVTASGAKYYATFDEWGNRVKFERSSSANSSKELLETSVYDAFNALKSYNRYYSDTDYTRSEYSYDYRFLPVDENVYNSDDALLKSTQYTYSAQRDANNRRMLITITSVTGDGGTYAEYKEYADYMGNTAIVEYIYDTEQRTYTYAYDYAGNLRSETDPAGNTTSYTYDYANRPLTVTNAAGDTKTYTYNSLGLVTAESDFMGNNITYTYDNAGRAITATTPFDKSGSGFSKSYYDPNGNVVASYKKSNTADEADNYTKVTNGYDNMNRLAYTTSHPTNDETIYTQYMYDNVGNLQKVISGISQLLNADDDIPADAWYTLYEYDSYGRVVKMTTPDGKSETYSYDYQDRLISDTDRAGRVMTYTYDDFDNMLSRQRGSEKVSYTYNLAGQRTSMTENGTATTSYVYNPFGQLTTETRGGIIKASAYDLAGNRTSFSVTKNDTNILSNTYTYDALGRMSTITNGSDTISYTYDANSNQLTAARNGVVYQRNKYNNANLTVESQSYASVTTADVTKYTYALDGNMRSKLSILDSDGAGTGSIYYYDGAGRLTNESSWGSSYDYANTYTYDNRGNRTALVRKDNQNGTTTTTSYTYNNMNQLLSVNDGTDEITYTYDSMGNRDRKHLNEESVAVYSYDSFNRLVNIGSLDEHPSASYTYDGDNLRQTKEVYGEVTAHIYDGANVVADIGDTTTAFVRGNGLELLKPQSGTAKLYITSPRGDTTKLINSDGTYTQYEYSAFGKEVTGNEYTYNPFEYCGEYFDSESGLIYLRNRYYDPEIGRFINEDPIMDGTNWYAYCNNDPVNFVDPWGLYDLEVTEDGKVYAIIETGDTLSGIAKDQVNDHDAYKKMKYTGDPNTIYPGQRIEITGIYNEQYPIDNVIVAKQKPNFTPNPNKRKGSENRQPTGSREKNVGHPDGEEHSRVPKGNNGIRRAETGGINNDSTEAVATTATIGTILAGAAIILLPIP